MPSIPAAKEISKRSPFDRSHVKSANFLVGSLQCLEILMTTRNQICTGSGSSHLMANAIARRHRSDLVAEAVTLRYQHYLLPAEKIVSND